MPESETHSVLKCSPETSTSESVADRTDEQGQTANHLYFPREIYINCLDNALYIADTMNNRIQKCNNSSQEGITCS
jgi:hypothetical protein